MRSYDNERLNKRLVRKFRYRRQRRKAQGFAFSTGELGVKAKKLKQPWLEPRQPLLIFVVDDED